MFEKFKLNRLRGMFKYHFVGQYIFDKKDYDSLLAFYEDRVSAIMTTYMLGLNPVCKNNSLEVTANGKSCALTFNISPKNPENNVLFEQDIDSLIAYQDFLVEYANKYFLKTDPKFTCMPEVLYYLFNTMHQTKDWDYYARQTYDCMIEDAKNNCFKARAYTESYDFDTVLASAYTAIESMNRLNFKAVGEIQPDTSSKIIQQALAYQFQLQRDEKIYEHNLAKEAPQYPNRQQDFWNYLQRVKQFREHPEMW